MFPLLYFPCCCFIPGLSPSWLYLSCNLSKMLLLQQKGPGVMDLLLYKHLAAASWLGVPWEERSSCPAVRGQTLKVGLVCFRAGCVSDSSFEVWKYQSTGGETSAFPHISFLPPSPSLWSGCQGICCVLLSLLFLGNFPSGISALLPDSFP